VFFRHVDMIPEGDGWWPQGGNIRREERKNLLYY
jgi:hypothetical protein